MIISWLLLHRGLDGDHHHKLHQLKVTPYILFGAHDVLNDDVAH
jgi:hypothetical protein